MVNNSKTIQAILPIYDSNGNNFSQIIYATGEIVISPMEITDFLKKWLYTFKVDLVSQRMWICEVLRRRNLNPIIVNEDLILIPLKTRKAIGKKDTAHGYVWTHGIQSFDHDNLVLKCGVTIPYLSTINTLHNKLLSAKLLYYTYKEELMIQHRILNSYRKEAETGAYNSSYNNTNYDWVTS